ncbi:hypothetical protein C0995_011502 [Termitomyces sp. Mi166|nr:hypothetical protein C0995_011502 [Termitomyces sp. Mi166\
MAGTEQMLPMFWQQNLLNVRVMLEVKILAWLCNVAGKNTKLLLIESIVSSVCHDKTDGAGALGILSAVLREAPAPLIANFGAVNEMIYSIDVDVSSSPVIGEIYG